MATIAIDLKFDVSKLSNGPLNSLQRKLQDINRANRAWNKTLERTVELLDQVGSSKFPASPSAARTQRMPSNQRHITVPGKSVPITGQPSQKSMQGQPKTAQERFDESFARFKYLNALNKRTGQYGNAAQQAWQDAHSAGQMIPGKAGFNRMGALLRATPKPPKAPKSFGQKAMDALMTSRFGAGGMMPLVGKVMGLIGPAGMALVAAMQVMTAGFNIATTTMRSGMQNLVILGGKAGSARAADRAAKMSGLGSGASAAQAMRAALSSGLGASYASGLQINPTFGPNGNMNYSDMVNKVLRDIANSKSFEEARRKSEIAGVPEAAQSFFLSNERKASIGKASGGVTLDQNRTIVEFDAALAGATSSLNELVTRGLVPLANQVSTALRFVENLNKGPGGFIMDTIGANIPKVLAPGPFSPALDVMGKMQEFLPQIFGNPATYDPQKAQKEQTAAIKENTRELKAGRETFGGGNRSRSSVPQKLDGKNWTDEAMRMGIPI